MEFPRIGILGGGQLARMLALSAHPLGLAVKVLTAHAQDPAAQVCGEVQIGALDSTEDVSRFLKDLDFLTFESEFADTEMLQQHLPESVQVFPSLTTIAQIQDRLTQKQLLGKFKIPTAGWVDVESATDLRSAATKFSKGMVVKQRRFGYDGYGTFIYQDPKQVDVTLCSKAPNGFIVEEFIPFKRELAVSFVRSAKGFQVLPLVESVQKNARCFSVCGPVKHPRLAPLVSSFKRMMNALDYRGVLAVELFDTGSSLIVNELAPRVHNSAHYSQDALATSQFEYHLRAGLGLKLPGPELLAPAFAMVNLLGEGGKLHLSRNPHGGLHWYGKTENRAGRKLGHINVLGKKPQEALKRALKWRKEFEL